MPLDEFLCFQQQLTPSSVSCILNPMHSALPKTLEQSLALHSGFVFLVPGFPCKGGSNRKAQPRWGTLQTEPWGILCSHKYQCAFQRLFSNVPGNSDIKYHSVPFQHFSARQHFKEKKMHSIFIDCFRETNLSYALLSWEGPLCWTLNPWKHVWVHIYLKALSHS